jgi:hypothetical protein
MCLMLAARSLHALSLSRMADKALVDDEANP